MLGKTGKCWLQVLLFPFPHPRCELAGLWCICVCVCVCACMQFTCMSLMSSSPRRIQKHATSKVYTPQSFSRAECWHTCADLEGEAGQIYVIWRMFWCDKPVLCWCFWAGSTTWLRFRESLEKLHWDSHILWKGSRPLLIASPANPQSPSWETSICDHFHP